MNPQTEQIAKHNCNAYNSETWRNTKYYNLLECGYCGTITHFRFKSTWKQIRMLFWNRITNISGNTKAE